MKGFTTEESSSVNKCSLKQMSQLRTVESKFFTVQLSTDNVDELTKSVAQEAEGSSPHSHQLATGSYPQPVESNPTTPSSLPKIHSDYILPFTPCLPSALFPSGFPTKTLYTFLSSPMRATCPVHLIRLDMTCLMKFWDEYKL
jgi:hypothetical protein